jgi:flagellar M-ring protein FliF
MDFLNQAIGQVRELFLSMTPAARVTAVLLLGVIGISLTFLFQQNASSPDAYLFGGRILQAREVEEVMAAIATAGLNDAEQVGNRIRVPRGQKSAYWAAVAKADAMPTNYDVLDQGQLETSPFESSESRRQRVKTTKERKVALILRGFDTIADAKVIYDILPPQGLNRRQQATAMVSIRPAIGETLDPRQIKMIKKTVAGAVVGLSTKDVHLANEDNVQRYDELSVTPEMFDDPYFQKRLNYELWMKDKIGGFLSYIPGVQVTITVELDDTVHRTTVSEKPDGDGVAMRESRTDDEITNTKTANAGRPGLQAQGPGRAGEQEEQEKIVSKTVNSTQDTDNVVGTIRETTEWAGFVPQQVQAAIAIPSDYLVDIWRQRTPDAAEDAKPNEEMLGLMEVKLEDKIKKQVENLLPRHSDSNPYDSVVISIFDSLPSESIEEPSTSSQAIAWASQNIGNMMMGGFTLISLVMLRSVVKSIPPSDPVPDVGPSSLPFPQSGDNDPSTSDDDIATTDKESRPRLKLNKGPTLKDDLSDIVREDAEAAASILRTWIDNAG